VAKAFGTHAEMQEVLMLVEVEARLERALRLLADRLAEGARPGDST